MSTANSVSRSAVSEEATSRVVWRAFAAIPIGSRSRVVLGAVSAIGLIAFCWPLLISEGSSIDHSADAPWVFALIVPFLIAVIAAEISDRGLDAKAIAMLGVLAAIGTALRPLGGGITGFQPLFVVLVLGGYAFGAGFGFVLGAITMLTSAFLTGGAGPWLPFQMFAAAWVGMGAGLLPHVTHRSRLWVLALYGFISSLLFGLVMNLSFWPWTFGSDNQASNPLAFVQGAPTSVNLHHFITFHITTSLGWDLTRGIGTVILVLVAGQPILAALDRAGRKAHFVES